ncbi:MAG: type II toxin-antitoxin system RelE/ParE family toxin [Tepidisphaeraceae bacterium]
MKHRIVITPRALSDLRDIREYIARRSPGNAAKFLQKLLASFDAVQRSPRSFGKAPEDEFVSYTLHQYVVKPYRVLYRVEGNSIQILHVRHGARRQSRPSDLS